MKELKKPGTYAEFLQRLESAADCALLLDYDGTLAPFTVERQRAVPYDGVRERLKTILEQTDTRLVIISGRRTDDLVPLLEIDPHPEMFGSHGWERLRPNAHVEIHRMDESVRRALDAAREWVDRHHSARGEVKPSSVAIHWRGLPEHDAAKLARETHEAWIKLVHDDLLELHEFDGGLELRASGRDKGHAVELLLDEMPRGTAIAFLGDDLTDEDAFRALGSRGLKVLVRGEYRETAADIWITPPAELFEFLDRWIEITKRKSASQR